MSNEKATAAACSKAIRNLADPVKAKLAQRFFRTGKGEYGEGDRFLGLTMPQIRTVARQFRAMDVREVRKLLVSPWHEDRMTALVLLVDIFRRGDAKSTRQVFDFYLANTRYINNWDLVDVSAPTIVGKYLKDNDRAVLYRLAKSKNLWERRIAIVGTMSLIRLDDWRDTLKLSKLLLRDEHDLMHKAVGWMLREVGRRDKDVLRKFLDKHAHEMPRTALRYALEHFQAKEKRHYMQAKARQGGQ